MINDKKDPQKGKKTVALTLMCSLVIPGLLQPIQASAGELKAPNVQAKLGEDAKRLMSKPKKVEPLGNLGGHKAMQLGRLEMGEPSEFTKLAHAQRAGYREEAIIPDPALRQGLMDLLKNPSTRNESNRYAAVHMSLDDPSYVKPQSETKIYKDELKRIRGLSLRGKGIKSIEGLENATNLTTLELSFNKISNLGPLKDLPNLTYLSLQSNKISNLGPLKDLPNLAHLFLDTNQISDLTSLKGPTNLTALHLGNNQITDLTPLKDLPNLTYLSLYNNQVSDLTPLKGLTNLADLQLRRNQVSDLTPLKDLTNLTRLHLGNNQVSDLAPLKGLTNLSTLELNNNQISDLTPLKDLTNIIELYLYNNQISDLSIHGKVRAEGGRYGQTITVKPSARNFELPTLKWKDGTVISPTNENLTKNSDGTYSLKKVQDTAIQITAPGESKVTWTIKIDTPNRILPKPVSVTRGQQPDISTAFTKLPEGATAKLKSKVDTNTIQKTTAVVTVTKKDNSTVDVEVPIYVVPESPKNLTVHVGDTPDWNTTLGVPKDSDEVTITAGTVNTKTPGNANVTVTLRYKDGKDIELPVPITVDDKVQVKYIWKTADGKTVKEEEVLVPYNVTINDAPKLPDYVVVKDGYTPVTPATKGQEVNITVKAKDVIIGELEKKITDLEAKLKDCGQKRKDLQEKLTQALADATTKQETIDSLNNQLTEQSKELTKIKKDLDATKKTLDQAKEQKKADDATIADLQDKLTKANQALKDAQSEIAQLKEQIKAKDATIADLEKRLADAQKDIAENATLKERIKGLEAKVFEQAGKITTLENDLSNAGAENATLREELAKVKAEREGLAKEIADLKEKGALDKATISKLEAEVLRLTQEVHRLEMANKTLEETVRDLTQRIQTLTNDLNKEKIVNATLREKASSMEKELAQVKEDLKKALEDGGEDKGKIKELEGKVSQLEREKADLLEANHELKRQTDRLEERVNTLLQESEDNEELHKLVNVLKDELETAKKDGKVDDKKVKDLKKKVSDLERDVSYWQIKAKAEEAKEKAPVRKDSSDHRVNVQKRDQGRVLYHKAYIAGYPDGAVRPDNNLTRAEFASMLYRLSNANQGHWTKTAKDIQGHWAENPIKWAMQNGYMAGYPDGKFRPNKPITRAELTSTLVRYGNYQGVSQGLPDMRGHWAENDLKRAYASDLIGGYPDGKFRPNRAITRAEAATILNKAFYRVPDKEALDKLQAPWDLGKTHWAFYTMMEATQSLSVV